MVFHQTSFSHVNGIVHRIKFNMSQFLRMNKDEKREAIYFWSKPQTREKKCPEIIKKMIKKINSKSKRKSNESNQINIWTCRRIENVLQNESFDGIEHVELEYGSFWWS